MSDTGPPYPPGPAPGSNAIGNFAIGISPIGTIALFQWLATIISQYQNSPRLDGVIEYFNQNLDQTINFENFFNFEWNVDTASGYGLDVWGRIVGVTRTLEVANSTYLGFEEAQPGSESFGSAPFYSGSGLTTNFELSDNDFRRLIFAKALSNICDGSIKSINQLLLNLFPNRGNCYVTDGANMTMTYSFNFQLSPVELAILGQSGVLPTPTGVAATVVVV